jgi:hypothetical protein
MKTMCGFILLLFTSFVAFSQGTSCNSSDALTLDGVCRPYTISATTGSASHCTAGLYSGTGYYTFFSFTTNAIGSCVLIHLTSSGNQATEVTLWEKCTSGGAGNLQNQQPASSVCFDDGTGDWAPCETLTLVANTVYYLRVWTPGTGTLTMCAKNYDPPNNTCAGATSIGSTPFTDNNACNKGSTEVLPEQLCAFSLENTAFYSYIVQNTGTSILTISNISCDNSDLGVNAAFQIGFFTGTCGSLVPLNCFADSNGTVQATTNSLPAGTKVTVAIDGMIGSNCSYTISAINALTLPVSLKYFTGWMNPNRNILRWTTMSEINNLYFDIEKSIDGLNFTKIGTALGRNHSNAATDYSFEDGALMPRQFYRLKIIGADGNFMYSNIVQMKRQNLKNESVFFDNHVPDKLIVKVNVPSERKANIQIIDVLGRQRQTQTAKFVKGENLYTVDIHSLTSGLYYLIFSDNNERTQYSFIKD